MLFKESTDTKSGIYWKTREILLIDYNARDDFFTHKKYLPVFMTHIKKHHKSNLHTNLYVFKNLLQGYSHKFFL